MGPRRQLGLSITFVDDDEVMGEGKGSPLGIAAIALVGDDAMSSFKSNSLVVALKALASPLSDDQFLQRALRASDRNMLGG